MNANTPLPALRATFSLKGRRNNQVQFALFRRGRRNYFLPLLPLREKVAAEG